MSKLPRDIKAKQLIKALERLGFSKHKGKGSHIRMRHTDGRWTQVAVHNQPIPQGTLKRILSQAGISQKDLEENY